jgi:Flp pilus assembly protein TadD
MASPHFEVYTDTGERSARLVLTQLEQARRVMVTWHAAPELSTRVLLFSSERDFARLRPVSSSRGFFQSGPERDSIVLADGPERDRIVLHEYTHALLNRSTAPLPQWLEEGLAEVYSTLKVGAGRASVGAPIPSRIATLEHEHWLTGSELAAVGKDSPEYNETARVGVFYAESWALVHMLSFDKRYRAAMPGFLQSLSGGDSADEAFRKAFGKPIDTAVGELREYVRRFPAGGEFDVPPADEISLSRPTDLSPAEILQATADILALQGRDDEADRLYAEAARRFPQSPAAQAGLAVVAMRRRDPEAAKRHFERAIALGARDGATYFEYAMLLRDTAAPEEEVTQTLEKAVAANPAHAEAHFILGVRASDAGRFSEAATHLERATQILPRQAYFWQALSYAYYRLGRAGDARQAAFRALHSATTDHEAKMARSTLDLIESSRTRADESRRAQVIIPESWNPPKGDTTLSGELVQVECAGTSARLHVKSGGKVVVLQVTNPRSVAIRGGPGERSLACGAQDNVLVTVEFQAATSSVTALEFR